MSQEGCRGGDFTHRRTRFRSNNARCNGKSNGPYMFKKYCVESAGCDGGSVCAEPRRTVESKRPEPAIAVFLVTGEFSMASLVAGESEGPCCFQKASRGSMFSTSSRRVLTIF
ncbi:hypothetical protein MRB53_040954 [Persea americana]|nr:hypothetical protein MRB53_040954 [Persea americana]